jgi:3-oxoacyl-[acyl-carrier protein] reductase
MFNSRDTIAARHGSRRAPGQAAFRRAISPVGSPLAGLPIASARLGGELDPSISGSRIDLSRRRGDGGPKGAKERTMDLAGKVALVTGSAVGTGRAAALALARGGCDVAVNYSRSAAEAEETAEMIRGLGRRTVCVRADVADDAAVRKMVRATLEELGGLDVLVNNAGTTSFIPHDQLEQVEEADWEKILSVNLKGPFYAVRAAVEALRRRRGAVVNVSSVAGVTGAGSSIPYCASKAALNNMTVTMARALAPEIRVNAVAPGFIDTRWFKQLEHYDAIKQISAERAPLKKVCQPEDVAKVIVDLVTSDLITGQVVVVDGGMTIA